jgi:hypothetical protein
MKSPITRILLLSLALLGTQVPTQSEARSPGKTKKLKKREPISSGTHHDSQRGPLPPIDPERLRDHPAIP